MVVDVTARCQTYDWEVLGLAYGQFAIKFLQQWFSTGV